MRFIIVGVGVEGQQSGGGGELLGGRLDLGCQVNLKLLATSLVEVLLEAAIRGASA